MLTNRAKLGALAILGVVAAGGGACGAGRQHADAGSQTATSRDVNLPPAPGAVTETENSLTPAPVAAPGQPEKAAAPAKAAPVAATRPTGTPAASSRPSAKPASQRPQSQSARPSYSPP